MIDSNREEFEKLPEVARMVACDEIKWCDTYHWYRTDNTDANSIYHVAWLNGAWYAFQEQQKKLDCCREENKAHLQKIDEAIARCKFLKTNGGDRRTLEDIELILKGNKDEN